MTDPYLSEFIGVGDIQGYLNAQKTLLFSCKTKKKKKHGNPSLKGEKSLFPTICKYINI